MDISQLTESLALLRSRVSPITVIAAVTAAGGVVIMLVGLLSVRRVSLDDEARRISGVRQTPLWEAWQMRLYQTELRIRLGEFVGMGLLVGAGLAALFLLLGMWVPGVLALPAGWLLYYRWLMRRRERAMRDFRQQLPDAIYDFLQYLPVKKDVALTIKELAQKGPPALRPEFALADALIERRTPVEAALQQVGQARPEAFFRQFMQALAQHERTGGDVKPVLLRIAKAQRAQLRLHERIAAQQAGAKFVGAIYAVAPFMFLLFGRLMGGAGYAEFYGSALGQVAQVFVLGRGWWLGG